MYQLFSLFRKTWLSLLGRAPGDFGSGMEVHQRRRYVTYLEESIDKGTQWVAFEPNGEILWARVRLWIEDFLLKEWRSGALSGTKAEEAFFVKCDRSTMTQEDLNNGRLVCTIGVAPLRPAEFVIIRIGQWTATKKDP